MLVPIQPRELKLVEDGYQCLIEITEDQLMFILEALAGKELPSPEKLFNDLSYGGEELYSLQKSLYVLSGELAELANSIEEFNQ